MKTQTTSAAELRQAAEAERREWGGAQNVRCFPSSSAIHLALADWLDEAAGLADAFEDDPFFVKPPGQVRLLDKSLAVARAINGEST